jgi:hypothetical protein
MSTTFWMKKKTPTGICTRSAVTEYGKFLICSYSPYLEDTASSVGNLRNLHAVLTDPLNVRAWRKNVLHILLKWCYYKAEKAMLLHNIPSSRMLTSKHNANHKIHEQKSKGNVQNINYFSWRSEMLLTTFLIIFGLGNDSKRTPNKSPIPI